MNGECWLACPNCGAELFLSARASSRMVFRVDSERRPVILRPEAQRSDAAPIDPGALFCGSCAWQGAMEDLVESSLS